ncbi:hypothetical protein GGI20_001284 [Coemansia sp. BCRC 34301]|nr:hypothetical protein GGI20_001284 [Coemansia sp. BCRC 34301]
MAAFPLSSLPHSKERVYVIVWDTHYDTFTTGLVCDFEHRYDQPLNEVRDTIKEAIQANPELNVNLVGKSWFAVSEYCPENFEKSREGIIANTRFILISKATKLVSFKYAGPILCQRLFRHYFPYDNYPWV